MLQRVMIAMAMSLRPKLLLADEPTTALDTMTQLKVLEELSHCQQQYQTTMLIVSHDLGVIARMADQIVVMRRGKIMEYGPAERLLQNPVHSYTKALVAAKRKDDQLEKLVDSWSGDTNGILYELDTNYWVRQEENRC